MDTGSGSGNLGHILQFLLLSFHPFDLNFSKFIRSSLNRDDEIIHLFRDKVPQRIVE